MHDKMFTQADDVFTQMGEVFKDMGSMFDSFKVPENLLGSNTSKFYSFKSNTSLNDLEILEETDEHIVYGITLSSEFESMTSDSVTAKIEDLCLKISIRHKSSSMTVIAYLGHALQPDEIKIKLEANTLKITVPVNSKPQNEGSIVVE